MDLGQALVISMLVVALIGALIVFTAEAMREAPTPTETTPAPKTLQWLNVSSTDATTPGTNWVDLIQADLAADLVELTNLATPGATADQLAQLLQSVEPSEDIDIATIWVGPEDLLAGVQLADFEESLSCILTLMSAQQAKIIIGNIPDMTSELVNARLALHDVIRPVIEQWNASIVRFAHVHGGAVVDFHDLGDQSKSGLHFLNVTRFQPDEEAQAVVAARFATAMSDAVSA